MFDSAFAYSPGDAARLTGVGRTFLYGEIKAGRLTTLKAGARTLIPAEELRRWIASLPKREVEAA